MCELLSFWLERDSGPHAAALLPLSRMPWQTHLVWIYWNAAHSGLPLQPVYVSGTVWSPEQEAEQEAEVYPAGPL